MVILIYSVNLTVNGGEVFRKFTAFICAFFGKGKSNMLWCAAEKSSPLSAPYCMIPILDNGFLGSYPFGVSLLFRSPDHYPLIGLICSSVGTWSPQNCSAKRVAVVCAVESTSCTLSNFKQVLGLVHEKA